MDKGERILLQGESSNNQINAPATYNEAVSSMAGPSTVQPERDSSETTNPNSYSSDTDSSSEQSSPNDDEEPQVKEMRRRLAFYQDMLKKISSEQQTEERAEGKRKTKAKGPTAQIMSAEMELHRSHNIIKRSFKKGTEEANLQGYVYGIVLEHGNVLSGCSDSLQKWWDQAVSFEQSGPAAAAQFDAANQQNLNPANDNEPATRTYDYLMELSDGTLASVQSAIMQACKPSQRKFPFRNKVKPPWWPTGDEPWWEQTGIEREEGQPRYKKPHDLRKKWKGVVVVSIIKSVSPDFRIMAQKVRQNKQLQNKMSVREMNSWNSALREEMRVYSREHPDMPLSNLLRQLQPQGQHQQQLQGQQQNPLNRMANLRGDHTMFPWPNKHREVRFTCQNLSCLHHDNDFGFQTAALRDHHQTNCKYQSTENSPVTTGILTSMIPPSHSASRVTAPPPIPPMHQPQQLIQPSSPPIFPPQSLPLQQMYGSTSQMNPPQQTCLFNAGVPNYPATQNGCQTIGQQQPAFDCGGFYNTEVGDSSNIGSSMQLLNEVYPDTPLLSQQRQQRGANSSMHGDQMENFMLGVGEGSSNGVFLQPGISTEMQLFPNALADQTTFAGIQTNVAFPQWAQSGSNGQLGISVGSSEPYLVEQSNTIPQDPLVQRILSHEAQTPPPSVEQNQFDTGNNEFPPGPPFQL